MAGKAYEDGQLRAYEYIKSVLHGNVRSRMGARFGGGPCFTFVIVSIADAIVTLIENVLIGEVRRQKIAF